MTRDEAELARRYRVRLLVAVRRGDKAWECRGATMAAAGETGDDARRAAHVLLDTMLTRALARVDGPDDANG